MGTPAVRAIGSEATEAEILREDEPSKVFKRDGVFPIRRCSQFIDGFAKRVGVADAVAVGVADARVRTGGHHRLSISALRRAARASSKVEKMPMRSLVIPLPV